MGKGCRARLHPCGIAAAPSDATAGRFLFAGLIGQTAP